MCTDLNLALKRLHVVDDLVEHDSLPGHFAAAWYKILEELHALTDPFPAYLETRYRDLNNES